MVEVVNWNCSHLKPVRLETRPLTQRHQTAGLFGSAPHYHHHHDKALARRVHAYPRTVCMYSQTVDEPGATALFRFISIIIGIFLLLEITISELASTVIVHYKVTCNIWNQKLANIWVLWATSLDAKGSRGAQWRPQREQMVANLGWTSPDGIPAETVETGTNLGDSPLRTSGQTSIGFQDEFYYNRSIKHYKGCIQEPSWPGKY